MTTLSDYCIGQLSRADANELIGYAREAELGILEFGVGGSTLLWAQFTVNGTPIVSVDSSEEWFQKTYRKLKALSTPERAERGVIGILYENWNTKVALAASGKWFDLIFIDGQDDLRGAFSLDAWRFLAPTGKMIFHDSRLEFAQACVLDVMKKHFMEISKVELHKNGSNLSVITKCVDVVRVRDDIAEGREPWETGFEDPPEGWGRTRR